MKLGTILLRDAVISLSQLEEALRAQVMTGGRLGTNLVELDFIDVDRLGHYLSRILDVPVATAERFEAAPRSVVIEFGRDLADLYTAFPLGVVDGETPGLEVAMADPRDALAVRQLATQVGYRIVPHAAAELRILYHLEKQYGIARKARYVRDAVAAAARRPTSERRRTHPAIEVPQKIRFEPRSRAAALRGQDASAQRLSFAETSDALDAARTRDDIADALVEFAAGRFGALVMLFLRGAAAIGWRSFTSSAGAHKAVERLALPLAGASVFQAAHDSVRPYRGGPASAGRATEKQLWEAVGVATEPADMLVVPIAVKQRVINLVYVHGVDGGPLRDDHAAELCALAERAAEAYRRLIGEAKRAALDS